MRPNAPRPLELCYLERRFFWGASELTIWELIGSVNTSAFVVTNQKDEPLTSGLLVIRPESMPSACSMEIPAKLDAVPKKAEQHSGMIPITIGA